jgi:hypothetical protein
MENGTDISCAPLVDNEISVDNDFSSRTSQSTSFVLSNTFHTERINYSLRGEVPCTSIHGNKYVKVMKASELKRCTFKNKTVGDSQEVPECEVSSDEDEQRMGRVQHTESHFRTHFEHVVENKRRKFESKYFI